jgi:hypothetical protein
MAAGGARLSITPALVKENKENETRDRNELACVALMMTIYAQEARPTQK